MSDQPITSLLAPAEPGFYPGVPMDVYRRWEGASNSRLSKLRRSPAHLKAYLEEPSEDTRALRIGRAIHTTILEPDTFDGQFAVTSQCTAMKKGDGLRCANSGSMLHKTEGWVCGTHMKGLSPDYDMTKLVVPEADYRACRGIREAVFASSAAAGLLAGPGEVEASIRWVDAVSGVLCHGRPDRFAPTLAGGTVVDIKSTEDASERAFERSIFTYGYYRQAAFYLDGLAALGIDAAHFTFIAVEKKPPYAVGVYRLRDDVIEAGRTEIRSLLTRYAECHTAKSWPGYPDEVRDIALPPYAWKLIDEQVQA